MLLLILILLIRVTFSTPTFDFDRHLSAITRYGSAEMKYWRLISVVVVFSFVAIAINNVREKRSQQRRDVAYQTALRSYSEAIKLGMTRKDVEDSLHARNGAFQQMCCVDIRKPWGVLDDLVKIGQEDPPWVLQCEARIHSLSVRRDAATSDAAKRRSFRQGDRRNRLSPS
jgi:hypothetical protein